MAEIKTKLEDYLETAIAKLGYTLMRPISRQTRDIENDLEIAKLRSLAEIERANNPAPQPQPIMEVLISPGRLGQLEMREAIRDESLDYRRFAPFKRSIFLNYEKWITRPSFPDVSEEHIEIGYQPIVVLDYDRLKEIIQEGSYYSVFKIRLYTGGESGHIRLPEGGVDIMSQPALRFKRKSELVRKLSSNPQGKIEIITEPIFDFLKSNGAI